MSGGAFGASLRNAGLGPQHMKLTEISSSSGLGV